MLTIPGPCHRYCDGVTRRSFLKVGGLALGGLTLPGLLQAETRAGITRGHKSVMMVYLSGGLAHQDTFDLKPDAPAEIRGEFKPIPTNVPGIDFGEHLPRLARLADKGTRVAPISIYRAIDALLEAGVIHRLESKNAFFACRRMDHRTGRRPIFLSCENCNAVQEVDSEGIFDTIDRLARGASFQPRVKFVEVSGLCRACQSKKD